MLSLVSTVIGDHLWRVYSSRYFLSNSRPLSLAILCG